MEFRLAPSPLSPTVIMQLSLTLSVNDRFSWKRRLLSDFVVSAVEQNRSVRGCVRFLIQSPCICLFLSLLTIDFPGNDVFYRNLMSLLLSRIVRAEDASAYSYSLHASVSLSLPMIDPGNGRDESAKANFVCRMIPQQFSDDVTPIVSFPLLSLHSCIRARQQ